MSDVQTVPLRDSAGQFDYSSPEGEAALDQALSLVLQIRRDYMAPAERKIRLYERTLGLAVIPLLIRRGLIMLGRWLRQGGTAKP